jgi:hypothetical protein
MSETVSGHPEKLFGAFMGEGVRSLIATVAGPRSWSDTRESWLARAADRAGITYRQTKALWYGEITDANHRSAWLMRDAAEKSTALSTQLDPALHGDEIAALRALALLLRGKIPS